MLLSPTASIPSFNAQLRANANGSTSETNCVAYTTMDMEGNAQAIALELNAHSNIPHEHFTKATMNYVAIGLQNFVQELDTVINEQTPTPGSAEFVIDIEDLMGGASQLRDSNDYITIEISNPELFEKSRHSPDIETYIKRAQYIVDAIGAFLGKLGRNEFEGDLGRWASNLTISGVRTGLVIGTLTTIRQLIGFALEKTLQTKAASPLTRNVIGGISLMIGPSLNVLGAIRDECNGTANTQTRLARLATLTLSMAALACAAAVPQALPALASYGPQMAFYTFAQDLVNLFLPIEDNSKPTPTGTIATGALNGTLQFLAFTAMSNTAPKSGPGFAMSTGSEPSTESEVFAAQLVEWMVRTAHTAEGPDPSPENRATQILASLTPVIGHDALRGAYNAAADVSSQIIGGEIMHSLQPDQSPKGFRVELGSPRIPTATQVAKQLLTTNAMRTSMSETIVAVVISASRYFSTLPISKSDVDHIANALVAAVVFAGRPGVLYVNQGIKPATTTEQA